MAKKKNNTTRNLVIGAGTVLAGGLALKSGGLKKAYNALGRLGKKRGKYNKNNSLNNGEVYNPSNNIEVPKKENVTQYINRTKGKTKLTKPERSALTKERQKKLDFETLPPEKRVNVWNNSTPEERRNLRDSLSPEEKLKFIQEKHISASDDLKEYIKHGSTNPHVRKADYILNKSAYARGMKEKIDELRKLGQYSRKLYLISDFTLM